MNKKYAYYNEIDKFSAAWIRELMKAGHIMQGEVDERSIEDVLPSDVAGFIRCHWFAGIAGWDYALQLANFPADREVWTGSCPCQPFSSAGKGAGTDDERHLWPAFFHLIEQQRPDVVFGEQVEAAIKHGWLDLVQDDLEGIGYAFGSAGLPAASVGAPHIRARAWFVADRNQNGRQPGGAIRSNGKEYDVEYGSAACGLANSESERVMREPDSVNSQTTGQERGHMHVIGGASDVFGNMANTECDRRLDWGRSSKECAEHIAREKTTERSGLFSETSRLCAAGELGNTNDTRSQGRQGMSERAGELTARPASLANESVADTDSSGCERRCEDTGRAARSNTGIAGDSSNAGLRNANGGKATSGFWSNADWLPCRDGKARPVESATEWMAYGLSDSLGLVRLHSYPNRPHEERSHLLPAHPKRQSEGRKVERVWKCNRS